MLDRFGGSENYKINCSPAEKTVLIYTHFIAYVESLKYNVTFLLLKYVNLESCNCKIRSNHWLKNSYRVLLIDVL